MNISKFQWARVGYRDIARIEKVVEFHRDHCVV